jgi:hypothetical protein
MMVKFSSSSLCSCVDARGSEYISLNPSWVFVPHTICRKYQSRDSSYCVHIVEPGFLSFGRIYNKRMIRQGNITREVPANVSHLMSVTRSGGNICWMFFGVEWITAETSTYLHLVSPGFAGSIVIEVGVGPLVLESCIFWSVWIL